MCVGDTASQPYFNLALFVDDNGPFMTSVTPGQTEIAIAVPFFKELVISLPQEHEPVSQQPLLSEKDIKEAKRWDTRQDALWD